MRLALRTPWSGAGCAVLICGNAPDRWLSCSQLYAWLHGAQGVQPGYRFLSDLIVQGHCDSQPAASQTDVLAAVKAAVEERFEDVNQRDIDDVAPLSRAVEAGNLPVVIYLLSKGADVEAKDAFLLRPVHYAASLGHATILRVLASRLPQASVRFCTYSQFCQISAGAEWCLCGWTGPIAEGQTDGWARSTGLAREHSFALRGTERSSGLRPAAAGCRC